MKTQIFKNSLFLLIGVIVLGSCIKEVPDEPPFSTIPFDEDKVLTIGEIRNIYSENFADYTFEEDYSVFGVVGMDESSGNIYESSFIQDETGGIQLNFIYTSGMYTGDSVRVNLKGATVSQYNGLYQINGLNAGESVEKLSTQKFIEPEVVTMYDLRNNIAYYQSTVIQLNNVQFTESYLESTFADAENLESASVYLRNCLWDSLVVRTSGYANFAGEILPQGRGDLIGIATVYNDIVQLVIREYDEVVILEQPRCSAGSGGETIFFENFDNGVGDWTVLNVQGAQTWNFENTFGPDGSACAQINGFDGGYYANEDWLISPAIDLLYNHSLSLNFETSMKFDGDELEVYIRRSASADWEPLEDITLSKGSYTWKGSGFVNLSDYSEQEAYIGFKYTSSNTDGSDWRVDNIEIKGE